MKAALVLGIGCRRGASASAIDAAVRYALASLDVHDYAAIARVASIDMKRDEAGLLAFCARHELPLHFYGAEEMSAVSGTFSPHARTHMNVDGVCEPCAVLASGGGELVVPKTIHGDVTVAVARPSLTNEA